MKKLALLFLLFPLLAAGCHHGMRSEIKGSGKRVMEKRNVTSFTSISTEGAFTIEVNPERTEATPRFDLALQGRAEELLGFFETELSSGSRLSSSQ